MIKEIKGKWWLPDKPERRIFGTLKIYYDIFSELELFGLLKDKKMSAIFIEPKLILGQSIKGEEITLYKCSEYTTSNDRSLFHINSIFIGLHFIDEEQIRFKNIYVEFLHLDKWFWQGSDFEIKYFPNEETRISYKPSSYIQVDLSDINLDYKIRIKTGIEGNANFGPRSKIKYEQKTFVEITTTNLNMKSFNDFKRVIFLLQDFFSFGIMKPAYPILIRGETESYKKNQNHKAYPPLIEIYYLIRGIPNLNENLNIFDMLFCFKDISNKLELVLKNWFKKINSLSAVFQLYFASLYNPSLYLEYKFLSLVQAIEAYCRIRYNGKYVSDGEYELVHDKILKSIIENTKNGLQCSLMSKLKYGNELSLKTRICRLFKKNIEITKLFIKNEENFIDKVIKTRNYLVHQDESLKELSFKKEELFSTNIKLKIMIEKYLLKEIGFDSEEIKALLLRNRLYKYNYKSFVW